MTKLPTYDIVARPIASNLEHIALTGFLGFEPVHTNSYAAWIVADGDVRFVVAEPEARTSWSPEREREFRALVIALAEGSPRLAEASTVGIYFNPEEIPALGSGFNPKTAPAPDVVIR